MKEYNENVDFTSGTLKESFYNKQPNRIGIITDNLERGYGFVQYFTKAVLSTTKPMEVNCGLVQVDSNIFSFGNDLIKILLPKQWNQLIDCNYDCVHIDKSLRSDRYNEVSFYLQKSIGAFYFDDKMIDTYIKDEKIHYFH